MLLPWGGGDGTIIADVVGRVRAVADPVVVVTGHEADATTEALADHDVRFVHNSHYADGEMISSVKAGVAALRAVDLDAFLLVLGDHPGVCISTFERLIDARRCNAGAMIISPTWNNRRGHPVLISAGGAQEILNLPPDATLKTFVTRHAGSSIQVPVSDPAVVDDIDTPQQYRQRQRSLSCPIEPTTAAAATAD